VIGRAAVFVSFLAFFAAHTGSVTAATVAPTLPAPGAAAPLRSVPSATEESRRPARAALTGSTEEFTQKYWTVLESLDDPNASVVGMSNGAQRILYRQGASYWVFDRSTHSSRRVDTFFDGTPLPADVLSAAISGDGSTVGLLRNPNQSNEPTVRIVRLDRDENFEETLPDAGQQTWSSGWVEHCSVMTRLGSLHLDDDGNVAWLTTSPCFYDRVLALDVTDSSLRWRFVAAFFRDNLAEVTADGRSFALGSDFYEDRNWNQKQDPDEPLLAKVFVFPIEFDNDDARPASYFLDWPASNEYSKQFCSDLPYGSQAHVDAAGTRMVLSTDEVGLDPNTIVYSPGRQLYWAERKKCQMHSLGGTTADSTSQFRLSIDGRSLVQAHGSGLERTDIGSNSGTEFSDISVGQADPLLLAAARGSAQFDPGSGTALGSLLEVAQLSGTPSALKVAIVGDSYISGEGSFGYLSGTDVHDPPAKNLCHRSVSSWAYQVGQRLAAFRLNSPHPQMKSFACSGATTYDVTHGQYTEASQISQLEAFDADGGRPVDVVFASIGGNDAGFKSIIETCAAIMCLNSGWMEGRLQAAWDAASNVETTLEQIKRAAPHATVFLTGYPGVVDPPDGDCQELGLTEVERAVLSASRYTGALEQLAGGLRIDEHEQAWLNGSILPALNHDLSLAAAEAGVRWIDPHGWFKDHPICGDYPFANGLMPGDDFPSQKPVFGNESFHPNPDGYAEMAARIEFGYGADFRPDDNPAASPQGIHHDVPGVEAGTMVINGSMQAWGDQGQVTIQGSSNGTNVVLGMYSSPTLLGRGTVGPDGTVSIPYEIPAGLYQGLHTIVAYDEASGEPLAATVTALSPPGEECAERYEDIDTDEDSLPDRCDASLSDGPGADADGDGVANSIDDCPADADAGQQDANENGVGDACDRLLGYNAATELEPFPVVELPRPVPTIELLSRPDFFSRSNAVEVSFAVNTEDPPPPVLAVSCSVDGATPGPCASPLKLAGLSEGFHSLAIAVKSSSGNASTSIFWQVDTVAPSVSVTVPAEGQRFAYGSLVDPEVACQDPPGSGIGTGCRYPTILDTRAPGAHTFTATAIDPAGNEASTQVGYQVEPAPPPAATEFTRIFSGPVDPQADEARASLAAHREHPRSVLVLLRCPTAPNGCPGVIATLSRPASRHKGRALPSRTVGSVDTDIGSGESTWLRVPVAAGGPQLRSARQRSLDLTVSEEGDLIDRLRIHLPRPRRGAR
jgi:lysophospholipase L1-like esterase